MDRVKKMANELLERYPDKFTSDFNENKETIKNFAIVRSKELRNKIAGYITKNVNRNLAQQNASLSYSEENTESRRRNCRIRLITVDLVGGIRKTAGFSTVNINVTNSSINEILSLLEKEYDLENKIKKNEIMIAINGVESSVLGGKGAKISSGDTVTILSVVHGG